ncbi:TPA: hypothetical protein PTV53_002120 [Clostridium botulinum]|nr:hypothetical protein [Clostridium botulinum]HDK7193290.1 hypothetical protein [Clostridium botulinum]HDK7205140.1 hypothetical protein [Clostridium botulinum]HDK7209160.1 hypothetical protein [Clostridium botulinum]HDK7264320.1 hypothetical protein [Clostridium botulinum]
MLKYICKYMERKNGKYVCSYKDKDIEFINEGIVNRKALICPSDVKCENGDPVCFILED